MFEESDCKYFEELINKRLDGDITPTENRELNQHLADCDHCREELISFEMVRSILDETNGEMVEVPDGFFEAMAEELDDVKPARGLAGILNHPFFQVYRNYAFVGASCVLVLLLTVGMFRGIADNVHGAQFESAIAGNGATYIHTNNGDVIVVTDPAANPDYENAMNDLEEAYRESQDLSESDTDSGYIHTSWSGGVSDNPIK